MLKKFFATLALLLIMVTAINCEAGTLVRVSDYSLNTFVNEYNRNAGSIQFRYNITMSGDPIRVADMSDSNYDVYNAFCGPEGHGTAMIMFVNKQGHVSKVSLLFGYTDEISAVSAATISVVLFQTLGFNQEEILSLAKTIQASPRKNNFIFWCMATRRYVHIDRIYLSNGLLRVDMYAEA